MTWRVAILGAGIGREHTAGYLALPDRFTVTQVCDLDPQRGADLAAQAGATAVTDLDAVLSDPEIDIIDICLPPSMHVPVTETALRRGKHVICEKPIAGAPVQAHGLVDLATTLGRHVFPVFQYRFGRAFYALRALEQAGLLGRPRAASVETHWNRGADYYANPWRGTWDHEMGGAVLSHAIHAHDLVRMAFGPVAQVSAFLGTLVNPIETEDCAAISLRMENGALVSSSITLGAADDTSRLRFVYEHLTAESGSAPYAPGREDWVFRARDPGRQAEVDAIVHGASQDAPEGFAGLFAAIAADLNDLDGQGGAAPSLTDGIASIELAAAIYRSDRTGAPVALPLDPEVAEFSALTP